MHAPQVERAGAWVARPSAESFLNTDAEHLEAFLIVGIAKAVASLLEPMRGS
jgi:hypothetical protein